jgi:hypothetical protein
MAISNLLQNEELYDAYQGVKSSGNDLLSVIQNLITIIPALQAMPNFAANASQQEIAYLTNLFTFCNDCRLSMPAAPDIIPL